MNAIRMSALSGIPRHPVTGLVEVLIAVVLLVVFIGVVRLRAPELARGLGLAFAAVFPAEAADRAEQF